jgi:hypothetical protein
MVNYVSQGKKENELFLDITLSALLFSDSPLIISHIRHMIYAGGERQLSV